MKKDAAGNYCDWRHIGNSFHVNKMGHIATCAHVLMSVTDSEQIVGCEFTDRRLILPVSNIRFHPNCDFAIAQVRRPSWEFLPIHGGQVYIGDEVRVFSLMFDGKRP